jgi:hypothetical protein
MKKWLEYLVFELFSNRNAVDSVHGSVDRGYSGSW